MNAMLRLQHQQAAFRAFAFQPGLHILRRSANPKACNLTNRGDGVQQKEESSPCSVGGMGPQRSGDSAASEGCDGLATLYGRDCQLSQAEIDFAVSRGIIRQAMEAK